MIGVIGKTPGGGYVVIDTTSFLPGRQISQDYIEESDDGTKPFFFIPSDWNEENGWGHWYGWMQGEEAYPICYSCGFTSAEEALQEATKWEATKEERKNRSKLHQEALFG